MNKWKTFEKKDLRHLSSKLEVKMINGDVHSIDRIVGVAILKKDGSEIDWTDIQSWREKKNWGRYTALQRHYQLLQEYDFEKLDDFEFAIYDVYKNEENREEIAKIFKDLKEHIATAEELIRRESEVFLKQ